MSQVHQPATAETIVGRMLQSEIRSFSFASFDDYFRGIESGAGAIHVRALNLLAVVMVMVWVVTAVVVVAKLLG